MNTIATKLQVGTAALAVAAAATLVPVAAQAAPEISAPTAPITQVIDRAVEGTGIASIPEFSFFFFGPTPSSQPPGITLFSPGFPILGPVSQILNPLWRVLGLNGKELCLGGASIQWGSYGGFSVRIGLGC
ncbi:hypothetical protein ACGFK1_13110 [Mycobacterium sp. NPDC048908]|uniref:hypothetical protein n=1 Tax=Mycobacterium sp. NPDC048908 TaxID=3364292 RepID=UPI0037247E5E